MLGPAEIPLGDEYTLECRCGSPAGDSAFICSFAAHWFFEKRELAADKPLMA
jgi:hypothetical protein